MVQVFCFFYQSFTLSFHLLFFFPVIYPFIHPSTGLSRPSRCDFPACLGCPTTHFPTGRGQATSPWGTGSPPGSPYQTPGAKGREQDTNAYASANPLNPTDEKRCCNSTETVNFLRTHLFPNRVRMLTTSYFKHILFSPTHFPTPCSF